MSHKREAQKEASGDIFLGRRVLGSRSGTLFVLLLVFFWGRTKHSENPQWGVILIGGEIVEKKLNSFCLCFHRAWWDNAVDLFVTKAAPKFMGFSLLRCRRLAFIS